MKKKILLLDLILPIPFFALVLLSYYKINNTVASIELFATAILAFIYYWKSSKRLCNSKGIFGLFWFGTIGLSCLQLHPLQVDWKFETWICLLSAFYFFCLGFNLTKQAKEKESDRIIEKKNILLAIAVVLAASVVAFLLEYKMEGFLPIFSKNMSSYKDFGITGLHYFTVSAFIIPILTVIYIFDYRKNIKIKEIIFLLVANIYSIAVPILVVSRQLLIMTAVTVVITLFYKASSHGGIKQKIAISALIALAIIGWGFISSSRNQDDEYIKKYLKLGDSSILSSKQMQTYTYVALNYDNFNYNVNNCDDYSYGEKSLFPLFALTGLKFVFDVNGEGYKNMIHSYTTMPIVIAPYMDFRLAGIIIYMLILGLICKKIETKKDNAFSVSLKVLMLYSLSFTFFYPTFSDPNIIFDFAYLLVLYYGAINWNRLISKSKKKKESSRV